MIKVPEGETLIEDRLSALEEQVDRLHELIGNQTWQITVGSCPRTDLVMEAESLGKEWRRGESDDG